MSYTPKFILLGLIIFTALGCTTPDKQAPDNQPKEESYSGMLQHTVYFYLNEDVTDEEKAAFKEGLEKLMSIEEIHRYHIGVPASTTEREVTDHSFGYSIFVWFSSMEDYDVYADHPIHLEFIDDYSNLWADVKVYDSELIVDSE
ncbi:Dabb family protein [Gracilimonas mengyeensis]|uniref:Stress responsive A/B Barrel Domain n=1 Tax=Gracilimonas mengyeensis TaxID=1302730 RepID=A0A521EPB2_9BACT|nr:Dabb family protein [Gracilimonas mengyeensis]SMO85769.1 Stress responsive A/B Barrel Domain [Gracilimonas mengyeensis]